MSLQWGRLQSLVTAALLASPRRSLNRVMVATCALLSVSGCEPNDRTRPDAIPAKVIALEGVELKESDSSYIGRPVGLAVHPSGEYFVIDMFRPRVLRYSRGGEFLAEFGGSGEGPGEFIAPSGLAFTSDTTVAVIDLRGNFISLFDRRSGKYYRRRAFAGSYRSVSVGHDSLWLGLWNAERGTALALWSIADDSISYMMPLPEVYAPQSLTQMLLNNTVVAPFGDSLVVGFAGDRRLVIATQRGVRLATFEVPAATRRGLPSDIEERMLKTSSIEGAVLQYSYLLSLRRLESGALIVIHADAQLKSKVYLMDLFVSVISPDFKTACVDARLPLGREAQPWFASRGDTLLILEQTVDVSDRPVSTVRRFLIDPSSCTWLPTGLEAVRTE